MLTSCNRYPHLNRVFLTVINKGNGLVGLLNTIGVHVAIYIIIADCCLEGFSQPAGTYSVFKLFKVKLILWDTEKFH